MLLSSLRLLHDKRSVLWRRSAAGAEQEELFLTRISGYDTRGMFHDHQGLNMNDGDGNQHVRGDDGV